MHTVFIGSGEGSEERALREEVAAAGLQDKVAFLGFRRDIAELTACLTLSILPTVGTDSSPTVLKEALSLRVPVIAADTGGVREVIEDGRSGVVVAKHDHAGLAAAVLALLDHPERARTMADHGSSNVRKRFSPSACAAFHEQLYQQLLRHSVANPSMV